MAVHFQQTSEFLKSCLTIENHLFDSIMQIENNIDIALDSVDKFAKAVDRLVDTLEQMYQTINLSDTIGEKSFPIREGRYRVFYKISFQSDNDFNITLLDIDDNKQSNLDKFPTHRMISFEDED